MKINSRKRNTAAAIGLMGILAAFVLCLGAVLAAEEEGSASKDEGAASQKAMARAVAVMRAGKGYDAGGVIEFIQTEQGVQITARLDGLSPGKHGFHIHQYGDISSPDGKSAGGHFNPHGVAHGGPDSEIRHVGDLGNIEADGQGKVHAKMMDNHLSLDPNSPNYIIGRAVVVHGGQDDLKTQPTGAAGPRAAFGIIGSANPEGSAIK